MPSGASSSLRQGAPLLSLSLSFSLVHSISRAHGVVSHGGDIHRREGSSELTSYSWFPIKDDRRRKKREGGMEGREKVLFLTREIGERSASFNPSLSSLSRSRSLGWFGSMTKRLWDDPRIYISLSIAVCCAERTMSDLAFLFSRGEI